VAPRKVRFKTNRAAALSFGFSSRFAGVMIEKALDIVLEGEYKPIHRRMPLGVAILVLSWQCVIQRALVVGVFLGPS